MSETPHRIRNEFNGAFEMCVECGDFATVVREEERYVVRPSCGFREVGMDVPLAMHYCHACDPESGSGDR